MNDDARWMAAAAALAERGRLSSWPNPNVGCVIVRDGRVVGRGWTQAGGRPHAEAAALAQAGEAARGSTVYVTLEPCAHDSARGPACADSLITAGIDRVVVGQLDPDPRTNGAGIARLRDAGVAVNEIESAAVARSLEGYLTRRRSGRPHVTLKLALSIDGCIARADGESRWITGEPARAHAHLERSRTGAIVVGRGTWETDQPRLDVRLPGLDRRCPQVAILSASREAAKPRSGITTQPIAKDDVEDHTSSRLRGFARILPSPSSIEALETDHVLVEGGAGAAAAFLRDDVVDRLLIYTAPILIGGGNPALADIGLTALADAHGRWRAVDSRRLGSDRLDVYERVRN